MSASEWMPIIASIGLIITVIFQIVEWRRSRFARGLETIAALDARFESPEFREIRRRAAAYHLAESKDDRAGEEAAITVINFFETIGFLQEKKVLDSNTVWHFFASWLIPYYVASDQIINDAAKEDPACFDAVRKLYKKIREIEEKRHPSKDTLHLTKPAAIKEFMQKEAQLELKSLPSTAPKPNL